MSIEAIWLVIILAIFCAVFFTVSVAAWLVWKRTRSLDFRERQRLEREVDDLRRNASIFVRESEAAALKQSAEHADEVRELKGWCAEKDEIIVNLNHKIDAAALERGRLSAELDRVSAEFQSPAINPTLNQREMSSRVFSILSDAVEFRKEMKALFDWDVAPILNGRESANALLRLVGKFTVAAQDFAARYEEPVSYVEGDTVLLKPEMLGAGRVMALDTNPLEIRYLSPAELEQLKTDPVRWLREKITGPVMSVDDQIDGGSAMALSEPDRGEPSQVGHVEEVDGGDGDSEGGSPPGPENDDGTTGSDAKPSPAPPSDVPFQGVEQPSPPVAGASNLTAAHREGKFPEIDHGQDV